jgi:NAD(P)-dependent dehydrogenase (short-subunit alcohol dehydrogenase family)
MSAAYISFKTALAKGMGDHLGAPALLAEQPLEEFIAKVGWPVPLLGLGRMGRAKEFANIARFLVPDASYVTGCAITVDGRRSSVVWRARPSALPKHGKAPSSLSACRCC